MRWSWILICLLMAGLILIFLLKPLPPLKEDYQSVAEWDAKGMLRHPMGIAFGGGFIYVTDTENRAITKFLTDGSFAARREGFKRPVAVATRGDFVYVVDFLLDRIFKFRSDGTFITEWGRHGKGEGEFDAPSGIAVDQEG